MNKIYFFNSANFDFAEIDLRKKNIFFVGDNGSGKTTAIRAIQYFFNSDTRNLGIESNKMAFKDFYFQYQNSYIVYEFDDFFVFVYKRNGEIKKIFSKQKFDVNKIIKNNEVVDLEEALEYVRSASLKTPANLTNEEYKSIIYGMNKKYRDFRITTIKNYNTFVNLYNKIFNVNKSVFDTNSIKEIIFTTIERVEAGEIEYESFKEEIRNYTHYFKFYKAFKAQEESIEKLYFLKEEILKINLKIKEILRKINYRRKFEENYLNKLNEDIFKIEREITNLRRIIGGFLQKEEKALKEVNKKISELEFKLQEIAKLKEKFSLSKVQKAKRDVNLIDEVEDELKEIITNLESLKREIKSLEESIDDEIRSLKRKIKSLNEEKELQLLSLKREIEEEIEEKIEKLKQDYLKQEEEKLNKIEELEKEIEKELKNKQNLIKQKDEIKKSFQKQKQDLKEKASKEIEKIDLEIKKLKRDSISFEDTIYELKRKISKREKALNNLIEEKKEEFFKEREKRKKDIKALEAILETKKGSFKEFLNENVDNWEVELYPIMDEKLLTFSKEELNPKIISKPIIGIKLDTSKLKRIPTRKEAEEKILNLKNQIEILIEEENKVIENLKQEFLQEKNKIEAEIEYYQKEIKQIEFKIAQLNSNKENILKVLEEQIKEIENKEKEEIKLIEANILSIDKIISSLKEKIKSKNQEIKLIKKALNEEIQKLNKEKNNLFNIKKEKIEKEFLEKKEQLKSKIENLQKEKASLSKDERINTLQARKQELEEKLEFLYSQKRFLDEFFEKKEFIEKEDIFKENLKICKRRKNNFEKFVKQLILSLEEKIANKEKEKESLEELSDKIKRGLKDSEKLKKVEDEELETEEFLVDLVREYLDLETKLSNDISNLRRLADKIEFSLKKFIIKELNVNFNTSLFEELDEAEFKKIDELYEFKKKKFEINNRTMIGHIKNMLGGILDKKLSSFEKAKEMFASQLRRINKNLEEVDFGIVKNIKIYMQKEDESVLKIFENIRKEIDDVLIMLDSKGLFFEKREAERKLMKIEDLLNLIKDKVNKEGFSIVDAIDIELEFVENAKKKRAKLIKNESSTGGSILLKIAIAVSLLELFIKDAELFLILDEVGVISTKNQKLLKEYVNSKGLGVIYVTPDLPIVDPEGIDIYKFRNDNGTFKVVRLINEEGIKIE